MVRLVLYVTANGWVELRDDVDPDRWIASDLVVENEP